MMTKIVYRSWTWFWLFCFCEISFAQTETDLYLFSLQRTSDGRYHVFAPKYLSGFNEGGITTQPVFTSSGDLLVSARKMGDDQNDIWKLSPSQKKIVRLTETLMGEFFPQLHEDGQRLSVLRKMPGVISDQQVYTIDMHSGEYKSVTGDIHDIGNYVWLNSHELGLFRTDGKGSRLSQYDIRDSKSRLITTSIGKSIGADHEGQLIYIHKLDPEYWYIKKYDPASFLIDVIAVTAGKTETFVLAPNGIYFMAKEHSLYCLDPAKQTTWDLIADISFYGINFITELAISKDGNHLALVATKEKQ